MNDDNLLDEVRSNWPYALIAVIGAVVGLSATITGQGHRESAIFGALIFLVLSVFTLHRRFVAVERNLGALVGVGSPCRVITGPRHAMMRQFDGAWQSEGVVWLGLASDPGSAIDLTLKVPANVRITWHSREAFTYVWKLVGKSHEYITTYTLSVTDCDAITPLGQFSVEADDIYERDAPISVVAKGKTAAGVALEASAEVHLLPTAPDAPLRRVAV